MTDRGGARHPLVELTLARFRAFLREPEAVFWTFAFPILVAFGLGLAFPGRGDQPVPVGVIQGQGDAAVAQTLRRSPGIVVRTVGPAEADRALRDGVVQLVVVPGSPPTYRFDPTRAESRLARLVADEALQRASGRDDRWTARDQRVVAPGSRYIDWLIPGLLGMNIMGTGLWSVGFAIVDARTKKLLKRLLATPMRRGDYLLSFLLARLAFLALEVGALLTFAHVVLGMPIEGSLVTLSGVALLGALSFGGLGLLLASRARTIEAVSGLMNVAMMPMWILSGVFFSSSNFPGRLQPFIQALPLTALNGAFRAVMLDGAPVLALGPQALVLSLWAIACYALALRIFRWS
jgi:ABC-type multidrug transport system permease subunit